MKDQFDYQFELLNKEMDTLQANIRNYDSILFRIKGWALTVFSGFVFFSLREGRSTYLLLGAAAVLMFWTLDATYKGFQRTFIIRYNKIEHFLRTDFPKAVVNRSFKGLNLPDVGARVSVASAQEKTRPLKAAFFWHTAFLYVAMLALFGALTLWLLFGTHQ